MKPKRKPSPAISQAAAFVRRAQAIKEKIGELLPAKTREEAGALKGKKGAEPDSVPFDSHTISAYRKIATNRHTSTGATIALVAAELGDREDQP